MDRRWLLGGILLAGGYGFVRAMTYRPRLDEGSRILLIGDSFAQGLLKHLQGLATTAGLPYVGSGIPGTTVNQWVSSAWLEKKLADFKPTHVLVSLGTNDAFSNKPISEVSAAAKSLTRKLQDAGAHVIWIGPPSLPSTYGARALNSSLLMPLREAAPAYFDTTEYSVPRGPDNLHPSAAGYAGWAGALWNWLT